MEVWKLSHVNAEMWPTSNRILHHQIHFTLNIYQIHQINRADVLHKTKQVLPRMKGAFIYTFKIQMSHWKKVGAVSLGSSVMRKDIKYYNKQKYRQPGIHVLFHSVILYNCVFEPWLFMCMCVREKRVGHRKLGKRGLDYQSCSLCCFHKAK